MKICLISNLYPPYDRGGAEQVVQKMATGLLDAGHEVVIISASPEKTSLEVAGRLRIYRKRPWNLYFYSDGHTHGMVVRFLWHVLDIFHVPTALWVRGIITREKPDVIHTHNLMGLSFLIPRFLPKSSAIHVHTVHDTQLVEPSAIILKQEPPSLVRSAARSVYTVLTRFLIGSPQIVISPSQFLLDFYTSRGFFRASKRIMLRNPVAFPMLPAVARASQTSSTFRFLYVGQIEEHKGILVLVRAFKTFAETAQSPCELHIVGNGSLLSTVQDMAKGEQRIRVYGRIGREELPNIFSSMDVLVVPSLCYENSPTVIFESMASGVPILASNIEGIAELITNGENGKTFTAGSADDLVMGMRWCLEHPAELAHMRDNTPMFIRGLSQKEYIEKLLTLYRS